MEAAFVWGEFFCEEMVASWGLAASWVSRTSIGIYGAAEVECEKESETVSVTLTWNVIEILLWSSLFPFWNFFLEKVL